MALVSVDDSRPRLGGIKSAGEDNSSIKSSSSSANPQQQQQQQQSQFSDHRNSIAFVHLGRLGGQHKLYASSVAERSDWLANLTATCAKFVAANSRQLYQPEIMSPFMLAASNRVNCACYFDNGRGLVIGTDNGLVAGLTAKPASFTRISGFNHDRIVQVKIIDKLDVILVVCDKDKSLYSYPLQIILMATSASRRSLKGERITSHVSFFKFGSCMQIDILCVVKNNSLSNQSTIHIYRPLVPHQLPNVFGRISIASSKSMWWLFRDCYIAAESSSIFFLQSKLCIGCDRGFEIVDIKSMNTQSLLDPADENLKFVSKPLNYLLPISSSATSSSPSSIPTSSSSSAIPIQHSSLAVIPPSSSSSSSPSLLPPPLPIPPLSSSSTIASSFPKPLELYKVQNGEFLLCYDSFYFFVNRNGQRARPNLLVNWLGTPSAFFYDYPNIIAFSDDFFEVRKIDTGQVLQVYPMLDRKVKMLDTNYSSFYTSQLASPPPPPPPTPLSSSSHSSSSSTTFNSACILTNTTLYKSPNIDDSSSSISSTIQPNATPSTLNANTNFHLTQPHHSFSSSSTAPNPSTYTSSSLGSLPSSSNYGMVMPSSSLTTFPSASSNIGVFAQQVLYIKSCNY